MGLVEHSLRNSTAEWLQAMSDDNEDALLTMAAVQLEGWLIVPANNGLPNG